MVSERVLRNLAESRSALLLAAVLLIPACDKANGNGPPPSAPVATVVMPVGVQSGAVALSYTLSDVQSDPCAIVVEFSINAGVVWSPATSGGGDGISGLASSPGGSLHQFIWNSAADGVAAAAPVATVRLRVTPSDAAAGLPDSTPNFTVNNSPAPSPPTATVTTPAGVQSGAVTLNYALLDVQSDVCSVMVQFSINGGTSWSTATASGGDGTSGLASSPGGTAHVFVWNSVADGVAPASPVATVRLRVTPADAATGTSGQTSNFTVNNSPAPSPPTATVTTPVGVQSGAVTLNYSLLDVQSDVCSVVVQFSINGGGAWSTATASGGDGTSGLASSPGGTAHTFVWNSVTDGVGAIAAATSVRLRVTPADAATGTSGQTTDFTVDNSPPPSPPTATVTTPAGVQSGAVTLNYSLADVQSDVCSVVVQYSTNGGGAWSTATASGGDGTSGLASSPGGTAHVFIWNSLVDGVGTIVAATSVRLRVTPSDLLAGTSGQTTNFTVNNVPPPSPPTATVSTPAGVQSGAVTLNYSLADVQSDTCSVVVQYSTNGGGAWSTATASGGDGTSGLASSPGGTAHVFVWNSVADGVGAVVAATMVRLRVTPSDLLAGTSGQTTNFTVDNRPPPSAPSVILSAPSGTQIGNVTLNYTLTDTQSDACSILVEFSINGGGSWTAATSAGGDGVSGLTSSPGGTAHVYLWNSVADGVADVTPVTTVRLRVTPSDLLTGTSAQTPNFTVDNNGPPSAVVTGPSGTVSGLVLVTFVLSDDESEACSVTASYSTDGGTNWSPASMGPGSPDLTGLAAAPGGTAQSFVWNSVLDGVSGAIVFRIVPSNGKTGAAATRSFTIDNSAHTSGSRVPGFPVQVDFDPARADWARSVASDGRSLYVFGFSGLSETLAPGPNLQWRVVKLDARTGVAVAAFGTGGTLTPALGPGFHLPCRILVGNGAVYLVGLEESGVATRSFTLRVEKRDAVSGALIPAFGAGGVLSSLPALGADGIPLPWAAELEPGSLVLAGSSAGGRRLDRRDRTTGASLAGFPVVVAPVTAIDAFFGLSLDASSLWLVGTKDAVAGGPSDAKILVEKRSLSAGALDGFFSSAPPGGVGDDLAEDAARDGTHLYVHSRIETGAGTGATSGRLDRINLVTGSIDTTQATGLGVDPTGLLPSRRLALDSGALYLAGLSGGLDPRWAIQKRTASTLALAPSFGTAGTVTVDFAGDDRPQDLGVVRGVLYVVGTDSQSGGGQWRIEAFWK